MITTAVIAAFILGLGLGGLLTGLLVRASYHRALEGFKARLQTVKDSLDETIRDLDQVEQVRS